MKAETLMQAIGNISDEHISEFASVKPRLFTKNGWQKLLSVAACIALLVTVALAIGVHGTQDITVSNAEQIWSVCGSDYVLVTDKAVIAAKGLPPIITSDMLTGDAVQCLGSNGRSGVAHEYISQSGENVMILAFGEQYYYLFPSSQQESE